MVNYVSNIKINKETKPIGGDNFNGQWVKKHTTLVSAASWKSKTRYTYSLENYLPDDDYDYEVLFNTWQQTDGKSTQYISIRATGSKTVSTNQNVYAIGVESTPRATASEGSRCNFRFPIKANDRNITIENTGSGNTTNSNLYARAYRRIGKNPNNGNNLISNIKTGGVSYPIGGNNFDGQWVVKYINVFGSKTLTKGQTITYSLENYLPDDGNNYEVQMYYMIRTGSTSGNSVGVCIYSGSTSGICLSCRYINTRGAYNMIDSGNVILPIFANAKSVVFKQDGNATSGNCSFSLAGYRRVGTNT